MLFIICLLAIIGIFLIPNKAHEKELSVENSFENKDTYNRINLAQINEIDWFAEKDRLIAIMKWYADEYNVNQYQLVETARCESGFSPDVLEFKRYGDSGKAAGVMQFHKPTFDRFKQESGMTDLDYKNNDDQILLATWAFSKGYQSHWTCWSKQFN